MRPRLIVRRLAAVGLRLLARLIVRLLVVVVVRLAAEVLRLLLLRLLRGLSGWPASAAARLAAVGCPCSVRLASRLHLLVAVETFVGGVLSRRRRRLVYGFCCRNCSCAVAIRRK